MNSKITPWLLCLCLFFCFSCEEDEETDEIYGNAIISTLLPNPDGVSGSAYMQLIENIDEASYDNRRAFPSSYAVPPIVIDDDVYLLPGWSMQNDLLQKYSRINGKLVKQGELLLPSSSGANNIVVKNSSKAYVAMCMLGKILVVDPSKMSTVKEIDLSAYGIGDNNPDPSIMLIRDNLLFVGLNQLVGGYYPSKERACVDILIIDTETDQAVKMITNKTSGMSMPTKPEADFRSIFMDENKDIYVNCIAGFGAVGHKSGLLRIKAGETEFDKSYQFVVNETAIEGDANKADYLISIYYGGNGKLYATASVGAYYGNPANYFEDRAVLPLELDLEAKTIKMLPIPRSNNFGTCVGRFKGDIIFGFATTNDNGFFTYSPETGKASDKAVIKVSGYPYAFTEF